MTGERKEFKRTGTVAARLRSNSLEGYDRFRIQNKDQVRAFQDELKRNQTGQREVEELKATRFAIAAVEAYESKQETKGDAKSSNNEQRSGCTTMVSTSEVEFKTPIVKSLDCKLEYLMQTENYFIGWPARNVYKPFGDINAYINYHYPSSLELIFTHKTSYKSRDKFFNLETQAPQVVHSLLGVCPIANDKIAVFLHLHSEYRIQVLTYDIATRKTESFTSFSSPYCSQYQLKNWSDGEENYVAFATRYSDRVYVGVLDFTERETHRPDQWVSKKRLPISKEFPRKAYNTFLMHCMHSKLDAESFEFEFLNKDTLVITHGEKRIKQVFKIDFNSLTLTENLEFKVSKQTPQAKELVYFQKFQQKMHGKYNICLNANAKYLPGLIIFYSAQTKMLSTYDALTEKVTHIGQIDYKVKELFVEPTGLIRVLANNGTVYEYDALSKPYQEWFNKYLCMHYPESNLTSPVWNIIIEYTGEQYKFASPKIGDLSPHIPEQWREAIHIYQSAPKSSEKTKALDFLVEQLSMSDNCLAEGYLIVKNTENAFPGVANKGMFARMGKLCQQIETESRASQSVRKTN